MVGRGIFLQRFLTYFESDPTTLSDGMDGKPDTGQSENAVFGSLTLLLLRCGLAILIQVEWGSDTYFIKVLRKNELHQVGF